MVTTFTKFNVSEPAKTYDQVLTRKMREDPSWCIKWNEKEGIIKIDETKLTATELADIQAYIRSRGLR